MIVHHPPNLLSTQGGVPIPGMDDDEGKDEAVPAPDNEEDETASAPESGGEAS